ncbi:hypothetical protein H311_01457, partial [Anncaliia algerae PRA109]
MSSRHILYPDTLDDHGYDKLKSWIEDSLDQFKLELMQVLYPIFIHTYFDLILHKKDFRTFFDKYSRDFNKPELILFGSFVDASNIKENSIANAYKTDKYTISMGKYAFNLLLNFCEENELNYILKLINQHIDIKVYVGAKNQVEGLVSCENSSLNLTTFLVSKETEDSILRDEKYKYDHLETFVSQLRKKRENKNTGYSASYINAEIEKLKDITKRISCDSKNLPSIFCYTIFNTYDELTCSELSDDLKILALGFKNSRIEIHSLDGPLKKLKKSSELEKTEQKEMFEETNKEKLIGHQGPVYSIKFYKSNKFMLTSSQDNTVRLWSLELFSLIAVYKAAFPIWSVDITRDFYFAFGGADKTCSIYSLLSSKPERIFTALSDVFCVKFHPNSNYVFYGSCDTYIRMYDIHNSSLVRVFNGHTEAVTCLDVSHCGMYLCSGSRDKQVILWDINTGNMINIFSTHAFPIFSVSFCWFGLVIASSDSECVRLFEKDKGEIGVFYTKNTSLQCVKFGYRNILSCVGPYNS